MSNIERLLAVLGLAGSKALLAPLVAAAQTTQTATSHFDPALLRGGSDHYDVILERAGAREVIGRTRLTLMPSDSAAREWVFIQETEAGPTHIVDTLWLSGSDALPRRQVVRGSAGTLDLTYDHGRVTGVAVGPSGQRQIVDVAEAGVVVAESALGLLVRLIPLRVDYSLDLLSYGQAFGLTRVAIRVAGLEETPYADGQSGERRHAWRLIVKTGTLESTVWVDPTTRLDIRAITELPGGNRMIVERSEAARPAPRAAYPAQRDAVSAAGFEIPETLLANLRERVAKGWAPGFVVGVVDSRGARVQGIGSTAFADNTPPTGGTIYEIGSVTKALTGLLLADMALRGELRLDDPVATLAPRLATTALGAITLRHLATHRAGLPRDPPDLSMEEATGNPFAAYDVDRLWTALESIRPLAEPGVRYLYSNLGFGLLGEAIVTKTGRTFDDLLRERVLAPLGMRSTASTLAVRDRSRLAAPYRDRRSVSSWDFRALHATGSLRSTADDLLRLLGAAVGVFASPLDSVFRLAEDVTLGAHLTSPDAEAVGLGWHVLQHDGRRIVWHDGGTGGYRSLIAYDRAGGFGVVVLTNSTESLDDVSAHLLDPTIPLPSVPSRQALAPSAAAQYVGEYAFTPAFSLSVKSAADHLEVQGSGQAVLAAWWVGGDRFFYRSVAAELRFTRDAFGRVDGVVLRQNGTEQLGKRTTKNASSAACADLATQTRFVTDAADVNGYDRSSFVPHPSRLFSHSWFA